MNKLWIYKKFYVFVMACHWMFFVLTVEEEIQYTQCKHSFILQTKSTTCFIVFQMINNHCNTTKQVYTQDVSKIPGKTLKLQECV